jgi:hypothetical protein
LLKLMYHSSVNSKKENRKKLKENYFFLNFTSRSVNIEE